MKDKFIKILILLQLFLIIFSILIINYFGIGENNLKENESFVSTNYGIYKVSEKNYNGFKLYTDDNYFYPYEKTLNTLDITKEKYPKLNGFVFIHNGQCDGSYSWSQEMIYIYDCRIDYDIRSWKIYEGKFTMSVIGHELGHYVLRYMNYDDYLKIVDDELWSDEFSRKLILCSHKENRCQGVWLASFTLTSIKKNDKDKRSENNFGWFKIFKFLIDIILTYIFIKYIFYYRLWIN